MDTKLNKNAENISKFLIEFYPDFDEKFDCQAIEEAHAKGYEAGFDEGMRLGIQKGMSEAISDSSVQINTLLLSIKDQLGQLSKWEEDFQSNFFVNVLKLTQVITQKVIPYLHQQGAAYEIEKTINHIIEKMVIVQPLTIRIHPSLSKELKNLLTNLELHKLEIDESLLVDECRVDWSGGGAIWNNLSRFQEIEELINDVLNKGEQNG